MQTDANLHQEPIRVLPTQPTSRQPLDLVHHLDRQRARLSVDPLERDVVVLWFEV